MDPRQLREATRPEHEATEAQMPLMREDLTRAEYAGVLRRLLPLVEGWEDWAAVSAPQPFRPLLKARRRSGLLRKDLRVLGVLGETNPRAGGTPSVDWDRVIDGTQVEDEARPAESFGSRFLGALYVMEGSTLGGRYIARHVETVLHLAEGEGNAYFRGHGEATGAMWREIQALIAEVPEAEGPTLIDTAKRTFVAFGLALQAAEAGTESGRAIPPTPPLASKP